MKIGLLTFHNSHNCGSMLQALALQNILEKKYNVSVEIIDFSNEAQLNMYAPIPKPTNWKRLIKSIIWMTNYSQMKKQYCAFDNFSKQYFHLSPNRYTHTNELINIEKDYDALIAGSDQVWNVKCMDADDAYYLSFTNNVPKYAYAVSFGANNPFSINKDKYMTYFNKFRKVSVREKNAQKWIKEATGKTVPVCLDPTMLFDRADWEKMVNVGDTPIIKGKYIFYYCFGISEEIQKFLKWLSKETGLPVYFMEAKEWTLKACWKNGIKLIKEYGPDVYMNIVKYSEVFVTSSFHGTAFATIYRKNFWYIKSKDSESSLDDRAISFLSQLNLMPRYKTVDELKKLNIYQEANFDGIDEKINMLRNQSLKYIESIIEDMDNGK